MTDDFEELLEELEPHDYSDEEFPPLINQKIADDERQKTANAYMNLLQETHEIGVTNAKKGGEIQKRLESLDEEIKSLKRLISNLEKNSEEQLRDLEISLLRNENHLNQQTQNFGAAQTAKIIDNTTTVFIILLFFLGAMILIVYYASRRSVEQAPAMTETTKPAQPAVQNKPENKKEGATK